MGDMAESSNEAFFARHAKAGCVGLVGGPGLIDRAVRRAQRRQTLSRTSSPWSHAFVFQGMRADGHHWLIESDIEIHGTQARIGVQENRFSKYNDDDAYDCLAVLDFGLSREHADRVIGAGLEMVATRARYSLREIFALYVSLKRPNQREGKRNRLSQDHALFCSALVQQMYLGVGIDFQPTIETKLTSPEDIAQTPVKHLRVERLGGKWAEG
jgi:hypothetical protein